MGFLDTKGLKKVVNWVKDYVKNNSLAEGDIQNKQDIWYTNSDTYIAPYKINLFSDMGADIVFDNRKEWGGTVTPDGSKEYKIRGTGMCLRTAYFPSTFDMPWPNNEIPEWEDDHEYEIYIAGGRVVSVDDITPPIEEVTYIIEASEGCTFEFNGQDKWLFKIDNSGWLNAVGVISLNLTSGEHMVSITSSSKKDLINVKNIIITNYNYLKIDCSKMKSNNLHEVLRNLKVDEIIYPQECLGDIQSPMYEFEAPEVNLRCLKYNELYEPTFNFKTDNFVDILFNTVHVTYSNTLFGENISNVNANKILSYMWHQIYYFSPNNLRNIKTVGTLYDSVPVRDYYYGYFKFCNFNLVEATGTLQITIRADEFIFNNDVSFSELFITEGVEPKKVFIQNVENLDCDISYNCSAPCSIYYVYGDPGEIRIKGIHPSSVSFIKVNSVEEVPFQYAPTSWDDVKNYDDEGNVID